jgi:hypothetical protein
VSPQMDAVSGVGEHRPRNLELWRGLPINLRMIRDNVMLDLANRAEAPLIA